MNLSAEKGVALLTVVIIIFILLILSSVMINLISSQTRLVDHDISRVKAKYANEATAVRQIELFRRGMSQDASHQVSGRYDTSTGYWNASVSVHTSTTSGLTDLDEINTTIDYAPSF
jgi:type II secretory pathway component PulK